MQRESFPVAIKERYCFNPGSEKETYHLVLDLENSRIQYAVGDCLGIFPENQPSDVQNLITQWNTTGDEVVENRQGEWYPLSTFLSKHANLARIPPIENQSSLCFKTLCKSLPPLLPRFYSIASSMHVVGKQAHLIIGLIDGVCTDYLCKRIPLHQPLLTVFHHPARNFSLPEDSFKKPLIMIGPGTGVAPFRGFMQERILRASSPHNWLFFGERKRESDFYYQKDWEQLEAQGQLILDCAFSRDQPEKIYVQHKMLEKSAQFWEWLEKGAYVFVCGDASRMAKDVDKTLQTIIEKEGSYSPESARAYIKELKKANRYQRDVY